MYQLIVLSILCWIAVFIGASQVERSLGSLLVFLTAIVTLAIDRVCLAVYKVKKAIEDKQSVVIQKRVSAPEQEKRND